MSINEGGQHRTNISSCGFIASGSPREANGKTRLHAKVCPLCSALVKNIPKFNGEIANANVKINGKKGWKQTPVEKMASLLVKEGEVTTV